MHSQAECHYKIWISDANGKNILGDGKFELLKTIHETGSLKAASDKLNISYRKAWGDLRKTENALKKEIICKHRGGKNGGKTELTPFGLQLISAYQLLHQTADVEMKKLFDSFISNLKQINTQEK